MNKAVIYISILIAFLMNSFTEVPFIFSNTVALSHATNDTSAQPPSLINPTNTLPNPANETSAQPPSLNAPASDLPNTTNDTSETSKEVSASSDPSIPVAATTMNNPTQNLPNTALNAYILIDAKTGQVLAEKNASVQFHPADLTKMMTAIVTLENSTPTQKITVREKNVTDTVNAKDLNVLKPGDEITVLSLLELLLTQPNGEIAHVLSEGIAPSREDFVRQMNLRANQLGAAGTSFQNPVGDDVTLADREHLSTAKDLAIIAKFFLKNDLFRRIVQKPNVELPTTASNPEVRILSNTNKLLDPYYQSALYQNVTGVIHGYTQRAGNCLVASATDTAKNELIAVVLGVQDSDIFDFTRKLLEYGFSNFTWKTLHTANAPYKTFQIGNTGSSIDVISKEALSVILPKENTGIQWNLVPQEKMKANLTAPISKGATVGEVEYLLNGEPIGKVTLLSNSTLEKVAPEQPRPAQNLSPKSLLFILYIFGGLLLLLMLSRLLLPRIRRNMKKKRRRITKRRKPYVQKIDMDMNHKPIHTRKFKHYSKYNKKPRQ